MTGPGPSNLLNLESVALEEVKCMPSVTCSAACASYDIFSREHPVWFSSYSSGIIKHIPKSARSVCASHLAALFNQVVTHATDIESWFDILCWPKTILFTAKHGGEHHNILLNSRSGSVRGIVMVLDLPCNMLWLTVTALSIRHLCRKLFQLNLKMAI
jgi:hypothetical protein